MIHVAMLLLMAMFVGAWMAVIGSYKSEFERVRQEIKTIEKRAVAKAFYNPTEHKKFLEVLDRTDPDRVMAQWDVDFIASAEEQS